MQAAETITAFLGLGILTFSVVLLLALVRGNVVWGIAGKFLWATRKEQPLRYWIGVGWIGAALFFALLAMARHLSGSLVA